MYGCNVDDAPRETNQNSVMPRLGLGIHEFVAAGLVPAERNSWTPRPSLGVTIVFVAGD
jgi:hypothetical protein